MTAICSKQDLFEARTDGYHVYRIPGILVTKRGTVVVYCEARKGEGGDWDPIDICMRRSVDGGVTFKFKDKILFFVKIEKLKIK